MSWWSNGWSIGRRARRFQLVHDAVKKRWARRWVTSYLELVLYREEWLGRCGRRGHDGWVREGRGGGERERQPLVRGYGEGQA